MRLTVILAAVLAVLFASNADARPRHHFRHAPQMVGCSDPVMRPCGVGSSGFGYPRSGSQSRRGTLSADASRRLPTPPGLSRVMAEGAGRIVSHPSGCPSRAFCGCGAAVRVFGRPVRSLWLAANWFRFPRTSPAPGTVAVRRHHVFVLERQISGSTWLVYDANSGGRRTRVHPRSIAGFVIVDPSAGA
jgi:hypothetical protein